MIALYARVSSDRQEREQTIASQIEALELYAHRLGAPFELYADDGFDGGSLDRPAMARLREALRAGTHDILVAYDIDRLARDQADLYELVYREVIGRGIELHIAKTGARFEDTAEGDALFAMFAAFAKIERRRIGERARRGNKHRVKHEGRINGGIPSFGFDLEDGRYVLSPDEVAWCRRMREWLLEGVTPGRICNRLALHEVPTKYDTLGIVRKGSRRRRGQWWPDQVRRILTDPLYGGEWRYQPWDGETVIVPVPAIFTAAELAEHRRIIGRNVSVRKREDGHLWTLRGLIRCGTCGRRFVAGMTGRQRIYRCGIMSRPKALRDCWNKSWTANRIEGLVWGCVEGFLVDPVTALAAVEAERSHADRPELRTEQLERRLAQLDAEDQRVRDGFRVGIYDTATSKAELDRSSRARELIHGELQELRERAQQQASMLDLQAALAEYRGGIEALTTEERGLVLAQLVDRVTVRDLDVDVDVIVPTGGSGQAVPFFATLVASRG